MAPKAGLVLWLDCCQTVSSEMVLAAAPSAMRTGQRLHARRNGINGIIDVPAGDRLAVSSDRTLRNGRSCGRRGTLRRDVTESSACLDAGRSATIPPMTSDVHALTKQVFPGIAPLARPPRPRPRPAKAMRPRGGSPLKPPRATVGLGSLTFGCASGQSALLARRRQSGFSIGGDSVAKRMAAPARLWNKGDQRGPDSRDMADTSTAITLLALVGVLFWAF